MFKSYLLSSTRLFAPEDEKGSEAKKVRESIKVETIKKDESTSSSDDVKDDNNNNDDESGEVEAEDDKNDDESEGDDKGEEDKGDEEKEETKIDAKEVERLQKQIKRLEKRVGRTLSEKQEIAQLLADANAALAAKNESGEGLTEEEVERRANIKAEEKSAERDFAKTINKLNKDAIKIDANFPDKIKDLVSSYGPVPGHMIAMLDDYDNGAAVLVHLAENDDEYEEIFQLPLAIQAKRLAKISDNLLEATKTKPKKISKVPDPIKGIKGSEKSPSMLPSKPTENMDEFVRQRRQQEADRRKAKYG